jgi:hypothetical protein
MKSRLLIILLFVLMVVVFAALNAASYVRVEEQAETEYAPDRSIANTGGTGTRALFEYLRQRGDDVSRWARPMDALSGSDAPESLVMVGPPRPEFERGEANTVLRWVASGGRLVIIDRTPNPQLLPPAGTWRILSETVEFPGPDVLPHDAENMTRGVPLLAPAQPTALTRHVREVTRSRFASRLYVYQATDDAPRATVGPGKGRRAPAVRTETPTPTPEANEDFWSGVSQDAPPPAPHEGPDAEPNMSAPVVHMLDGREGPGALLVDYGYGRGRIVILSDPYIVSNAGVNRADNLFLAANVVTGGRKGRVAFDEFHHGYGETRNQLFAYFRGTPILWMFAQGALVALALIWTSGRRFARPLPAPRTDRRSKLEFVSSMAELQHRARAYDLAVENIYQRTRRALARYAGLPASATAAQIAERVAARSGRDRTQIESLLRELERDLGVLMRSREIRQAR